MKMSYTFTNLVKKSVIDMMKHFIRIIKKNAIGIFGIRIVMKQEELEDYFLIIVEKMIKCPLKIGFHLLLI